MHFQVIRIATQYTCGKVTDDYEDMLRERVAGNGTLEIAMYDVLFIVCLLK